MEYFKPYLKESSLLEYKELIKKNDVFYVDNKEVTNNRAINGDIVYVSNSEVVGLKKRNTQNIVGILHLNTNQKYGFTKRNVPYYKFTSISHKFPNFIIPSKSKEKKAIYCVIKINKWETKNKLPIGQIEKLLGPVGDNQNEINMLLYHTEIFPKKNKTKYNDLEVPKTYEYNTYSIDPVGCKDIDDALHYREYDDKIEIGIHIANVARHIEKLDTNFYSSVYLDDQQINMLDDNLTYNVCSLGCEVPRKSMSLILTYQNNKLINSEFKEAIVKNTPLSYKKVDQIIEHSIKHSILNLYKFTLVLNNCERMSATKMVEYYMLQYNSIMAETLYSNNPNTILRTHELVKNNFGTNDEKLQIYLNKVNQNAAKYTSNPEKTFHEDLNFKFYTHATSPIRRYIDILNQQNMIKLLQNGKININEDLDNINLFQKKLRKFYNYYKKLKLIFKITKPEIHEAYIIGITNLKVKIFIPELDIEHGFLLLSNKLTGSNEIILKDSKISINKVEFKMYDKIKIKVTSLPYEEKFNKKLNITVLEPYFKIL